MTPIGTLSLGQLIGMLESRNRDQVVRFSTGLLAPTDLASYRGIYNHLALGYSMEQHLPNVGELLKLLRAAVGSDFEGWKGGSFRMKHDTPIWVANRGEHTNTAIIGLAECDDQTIVETKFVKP